MKSIMKLKLSMLGHLRASAFL